MARRPNSCPICGRPAARECHPFCTPRCQDVDLGRWLTGVYRIAGPPAEADEESPPESDA